MDGGHGGHGGDIDAARQGSPSPPRDRTTYTSSTTKTPLSLAPRPLAARFNGPCERFDGDDTSLQGYFDRFLSAEIFNGGASAEIENVQRLVQRPFVPFFRRQWRRERMALVQNFLVFLESQRNQVQKCISVASIHEIEPLTLSDLATGHSSGAGSVASCVSGSTMEASPAAMSSSGYGFSPSPAGRLPALSPEVSETRQSSPSGFSHSFVQSSGSASTPAAGMPIRIRFRKNGKQKQVAVWINGNRDWIQALENARHSETARSTPSDTSGQFVPVEYVRKVASRHHAEVASRTAGRCDTLKASRELEKQFRLGLLAFVVNSIARRRQLSMGIRALRTARSRDVLWAVGVNSLIGIQKNVLSRTMRHLQAQCRLVCISRPQQNTASEDAAKLQDRRDDLQAMEPEALAKLAESVGLSKDTIGNATDAELVEQILVAQETSYPSVDSAHERAAEALIEELQSLWQPLWTPRMAVMGRSLKPVVKRMQAATMAQLSESSSHDPLANAIDDSETQKRSCYRFGAEACARCLAQVVRRWMRRHLSSAWRTLICTLAQVKYDSCLNLLEQRLQQEEETSLVDWEFTSRHYGARRLTNSIRRVFAAQTGSAFATLIHWRASSSYILDPTNWLSENLSDEALETPRRPQVDTATTGPVISNPHSWTPSWGTPAETPGATPRESPAVSGSTPCDAEDKLAANSTLTSAAMSEATKFDDDSSSVFTWSKPFATGLLEDAPFIDRGLPQTDDLPSLSQHISGTPTELQLSHEDLDHTVAVDEISLPEEESEFDLQEALPRTSGALQELRFLSQSVVTSLDSSIGASSTEPPPENRNLVTSLDSSIEASSTEPPLDAAKEAELIPDGATLGTSIQQPAVPLLAAASVPQSHLEPMSSEFHITSPTPEVEVMHATDIGSDENDWL